MTKAKIKNLLDFIPLVIITISAIILIWKVGTGEIGFLWKHIVGLGFLSLNYLLFFWRHKIGVLGLGVTLLIGLAGVLSYSPAISMYTLYKGSDENGIPFFYGQPIFILWILIHLILSGRHYVGIATKRYWLALSNNSTISFD